MIQKTLLVWILATGFAIAAQASAVIEIELPSERELEEVTLPIRETEEMAADRRAMEAVQNRLKETIIPKVEIKDVTIREALAFLQQKTGVPMILMPPVFPRPVLDVDDVAPSQQVRVTLSLTNVPAFEVLRYITSLACLKFSIEPGAVLIAPMGTTCGVLPTAVFEVPSAVAGKITKEFLESKGVWFPHGSRLSYDMLNERLTIRTVHDSMDRFYDILTDLHEPSAPRKTADEKEADRQAQRDAASRFAAAVFQRKIEWAVVRKAEIKEASMEEIQRVFWANEHLILVTQVESGERITLSMKNELLTELLNKLAKQTNTRVVIGARAILLVPPMTEPKP